ERLLSFQSHPVPSLLVAVSSVGESRTDRVPIRVGTVPTGCDTERRPRHHCNSEQAFDSSTSGVVGAAGTARAQQRSPAQGGDGEQHHERAHPGRSARVTVAYSGGDLLAEVHRRRLVGVGGLLGTWVVL